MTNLPNDTWETDSMSGDDIDHPDPSRPNARWYDVPVRRDADGMIGGVVGGLSRAYGFDPRTTRIAVAIAACVVPVVIPVYIALWVLLPKSPEAPISLRETVSDRRRMPLMAVLAVIILLGAVGSIGWGFGLRGFAWGVALILVGVLLWAASMENRTRGRSDTGAGGPGAGGPGAGGPVGASLGWPEPSGAPIEPTLAERGVTAVPQTTVSRTQPRATSSARRRVPIVGWSLVAMAAAVAVAAAGEGVGWWNVSAFGVTLAFLGGLLTASIASAVVNRRVAIGLLGIPVSVAIVTLAVLEPTFEGGVGRQSVVPTDVAAAAGPYELALGELTVDLTDISFDETPLLARAKVGFGRLEVLVPDFITVEVLSHVGAGQVVVDDVTVAEGFRYDKSVTDIPRLADGRIIQLELEVGAGQISVVREHDRSDTTGPTG
jgi:phage shock protein PspC (stress-responsive transcriptional regulator)